MLLHDNTFDHKAATNQTLKNILFYTVTCTKRMSIFMV